MTPVSPRRAWLGLAVAAALTLASPPRPASAQFSDPCEVDCALILGATAFTTATGAAVAWGRYGGGLSTVREGLLVWGVSFAVVSGSGIALSGNGGRQRRAVRGAGIGALAGSVLWLGIESTQAESDGARKVAATLMGAALGTVLGGVYSALTYDDDVPGDPTPLLTVRLSL